MDASINSTRIDGQGGLDGIHRAVSDSVSDVMVCGVRVGVDEVPWMS